MAVGEDVGAVLHHHARSEEHVGLDRHIAADHGVEAQPHGLGRHQRGPLLHNSAPGAGLEDGLGGGQLLARIDAERLLGRTFDRPGNEAVGGRNGHRVGEIVLVLGVAIGDAAEQPSKVGHPKPHGARIAQADAPLRVGGIALFADRLDTSVCAKR